MPKIQKPWCIPISSCWYVGKVEKESESVAWLKFNEEQRCPSSWERGYLWRFETLEEAIKKWVELKRITLRMAAKEMLLNFPSERKVIRAMYRTFLENKRQSKA